PTPETTQPTPTQATPTPVPIDTLELTPTSTYDFTVGVFEQNPGCGNDDTNKAILDGLRDLGFRAEEIPLGSTDYSSYRVLYLPYGWSCAANNYAFGSIRSFLD